MRRSADYYWVEYNNEVTIAKWNNGDGIPHPPANPDADWGWWDIVGSECPIDDREIKVLAKIPRVL